MKDKPYALTLTFEKTGVKIIISNNSEVIIGNHQEYKDEILTCTKQLLATIAGNYKLTPGVDNCLKACAQPNERIITSC